MSQSPEGTTPEKVAQDFCTACRSQLVRGALFCSHCGVPAAGKTIDPQFVGTQPEKQTSGGNLLMGLSALIISIVFAYYLLVARPAEQTKRFEFEQKQTSDQRMYDALLESVR